MTDSRVIRDCAAKAQMAAFITALLMYNRDVGDLPTDAEGLQALWRNSGVSRWNGPYLTREIPLDPWGREYRYRRNADRTLELRSFGPADAAPIVITSKPVWH